MKFRIVMLSCLCLSMFSSPAIAGCWACGADHCCKEAEEDSWGRDTCLYEGLCIGNQCTCSDCWTHGTACEGTAPKTCDKPFDTREEHQTLLLVPNGEPIDLLMLTQPPALDLRTTVASTWTCGPV